MTFVRICSLLAAAFVAAFAGLTPANADVLTFSWILSGPSASLGGFPFAGSGTFTVSTGAGGDLITGISGVLTNGTGTVTDVITGLLPAGSMNGNDNLLFPIGTTFSGPPVASGSYVSVENLDIHGVAFTTTGASFLIFGGLQPNSSAPDPTHNNYDELGAGFGVGHFDVAETPLPAALPLFGTGLSALGLLGWKRKRKAAA